MQTKLLHHTLGNKSDNVQGRQRLSMLARTTIVGILGLLGVSIATAQNWPAKTVRIINPFPAGGGTDTFARPLAARLTQALGQTVIIENIGGAGGTVGAGNAARATPDGYTYFMGAVHHTIAETLYTKLPYALERDFIPITLVASVPNVVVVHPKHGFKTLKEFMDYARSHPDQLNFGTAGNGTTHHVAVELFKTLTGLRLVHIPYKGAGPLMQDLLAGQVDFAFDSMGTSANQIRAGKLRALAVTASSRSAIIPDVPTMSEAGITGYGSVTTWYALWAIKGAPQNATDRMYAETAKAMQQSDLKQIWDAQGAVAGGQPPAEFAAYVKSEIAKWGKVVRDAGIRIDL